MEGLLAVLLIYYGPLAVGMYLGNCWPRSQARIDFWRAADKLAFRLYVWRENNTTTTLMEFCESKHFVGTEVTSNPVAMRR